MPIDDAARLALYLDAERRILEKGQSVEVDGVQWTSANLADLRKAIEDLRGLVNGRRITFAVARFD